MQERLIAGGPTTDAPADPAHLAAAAYRVLDALRDGGIAIVPSDLGYGIAAFTPEAMARCFAAKQRSLDKPCGMYGSPALSRDIHDLPSHVADLIEAVVCEDGIPFSIVAPLRRDADGRPAHEMLRATPATTLPYCTKGGTMDMVLAGGPFHDALVAACVARTQPVFGSSANRSLAGTKYALDDVEAEVLAAADVLVDAGRCRYATPLGLSSTVIDMRDFAVIRKGHRYDEIKAAFARRAGIVLP